MRKSLYSARFFSAITLSYLLLSHPTAHATQAQEEKGSKTGFTRSETEGIIRDYLLNNPEIMYEVQKNLEKKQEHKKQDTIQRVISESADLIFNSPYDGITGNPEGTTTVVEFFDYNCGYCKRALQDMEALTAQDKDLRFVLKELPILGKDSQEAHVVSMAFRALMPQKYIEFHKRLLGGSVRATEKSAMKIALDLGAKEADLRKEMNNPEIITTVFRGTLELAYKLQITGTPTYLIGQEVFSGAVGRELLHKRIQDSRK